MEEECDDPTFTLSVPTADADSVKMLSASPSPPREETDSAVFPENKEGLNHEDDEDLRQQWDASLYMLQSQAPHPRCVHNHIKLNSTPPFSGSDYHGILTREETADLLGIQDGSYLVRETKNGIKILSFMMSGRMYNYILYNEDGLYYVGENHFESIEDVVQDVLITLYLQQHNVAQTMHEGQMQSMARRKRTEKKLNHLKRAHGKRVKGLKGKKAWEFSRTISGSSISSIPSPSPTPSPSPSPPLVDYETLRPAESCPEESDLDYVGNKLRISTPNLRIDTELDTSLIHHEQIRTSVSSLPSMQRDNNRFSVIISTLRDALNEDKKRESLRLDNSGVKLKTCSSEGRIVKSCTFSESRSDQVPDVLSMPSRTKSCHIVPANKLIDNSIRGTTSLSRSSVNAFTKHTTGPKSPYYKAHQFVPHTYLGLAWCEICHHFLWGLKHQGLRCKNCGMDIHKQCLPLALQLECYPNKQCVKRVFGVDLTTLVKLEGGVIPNILRDCINELHSRDLTVKGIYRVSGQTSEILFLKEKYDSGESVDLSAHLDIGVITGAIKLYLRELPIPLIPFDTYKEIMKATVAISDPEDPELNWNSFRCVLKLLPKAHYNTLEHLSQHLYKIHSLSMENLMTAENLAVVFAPTLMKSPHESMTLIKDLPIQRNFIENLILKHEIIFV